MCKYIAVLFFAGVRLCGAWDISFTAPTNSTTEARIIFNGGGNSIEAIFNYSDWWPTENEWYTNWNGGGWELAGVGESVVVHVPEDMSVFEVEWGDGTSPSILSAPGWGDGDAFWFDLDQWGDGRISNYRPSDFGSYASGGTWVGYSGSNPWMSFWLGFVFVFGAGLTAMGARWVRIIIGGGTPE